MGKFVGKNFRVATILEVWNDAQNRISWMTQLLFDAVLLGLFSV